MKALNKKLIRDLIHMRGQVIAVALVVACGVASFIALRNIYRSLLLTQQAYYQEYRFADVFAQLKRAPNRLEARIAEIPGVASVQTRIVAGVTLDVPGVAEPAAGLMVSVPDKKTRILNDLHLISGRYMEPGARNEVIISEAFAAKNGFKPGDSLSGIINGRWSMLRIAGIALSPEYVYEIRPGDLFPDSRHFGVIWISRDTIERAFDMEGAFNNVTLSLSRGTNEAEVIRRLDSLLEEYGGLGAYGRVDQVSNHFVDNELAELQVSGTFVPAVFLLVTAFLLHLVLSRLVSTQRDQIAVMKSFGYGNFPIGWHYLKLSYSAVFIGIVLGIGLGWFFGYQMTALYARFFRFPILRYEMDPLIISLAALITLGSASLGALRAVQKAVSLPPAEAMRPESPAKYRMSSIERLGLHRFLPIELRIIARNMERNIVKSVLTVISIAMAVSLLVVGFYFFDAIDQIIDIQFNRVFREDANVVFNETRSSRVKQEMAAMPGVMKVEGYRAVPVRLRFEHRYRRTALLGVQHDGELQRLVDKDDRIINIPPEGLVLTSKLGEILGVRPGDSVTVEVLEGSRPIRQIQVVSMVDEVLGMTAYMDSRALNRLMREGENLSGLRLMIDSKSMDTLYSKLKRTPAVAAVLIPEAVLKNFNETLAQTIYISTSAIIFFACVIAFGMVYNGARIALSERGRELASLRVLGFTKAEIGLMLLGEQAILTLLAVPIGILIGMFLCYLIIHAADTEMIRFPLTLSLRTYALAFIIITAAASLSGLLIGNRLSRLDLIEVLKTRE